MSIYKGKWKWKVLLSTTTFSIHNEIPLQRFSLMYRMHIIFIGSKRILWRCDWRKKRYIIFLHLIPKKTYKSTILLKQYWAVMCMHRIFEYWFYSNISSMSYNSFLPAHLTCATLSSHLRILCEMKLWFEVKVFFKYVILVFYIHVFT